MNVNRKLADGLSTFNLSAIQSGAVKVETRTVAVMEESYTIKDSSSIPQLSRLSAAVGLYWSLLFAACQL